MVNGWAEVSFEGSTEEFLLFAQGLGTPTPSRKGGAVVDRLKPVEREAAHPRSMSARYGKGGFPFHTDGAYLRTPPRYVLLRLVEGRSDRPTLLLRPDPDGFSPQDWQALKRDVWIVNGGRGRYLTPLINDTQYPGRQMLRYDQECMRPFEPGSCRSAQVMQEYIDRAEPQACSWTRGKVLVIDNWSVMHGRGEATAGAGEHRVLERVLVTNGEDR